MHVLLGLLGTIITILILLNRLAEAGIDLGGLNPFLWRRRRKWQKKVQGNPIYSIESPLEVTALLAVGVAKSDGDMSSEEKRLLLSLFQSEFNLSKKEAAELLIGSAYLLGTGEELRNKLDKVLEVSLNNFTEEQSQSALALLEKVRDTDPSERELKIELVAQVKRILEIKLQPPKKWS